MRWLLTAGENGQRCSEQTRPAAGSTLAQLPFTTRRATQAHTRDAQLIARDAQLIARDAQLIARDAQLIARDARRHVRTPEPGSKVD